MVLGPSLSRTLLAVLFITAGTGKFLARRSRSRSLPTAPELEGVRRVQRLVSCRTSVCAGSLSVQIQKAVTPHTSHAGQPMAEMPSVKPGDWIHMGGYPGLDLVVCNIRQPEFIEHSGHLEAVYLDERNRAINVDVRWDGERWVFVRPQPDGGYADNYQRLRDCVQILRRGRYR